MKSKIVFDEDGVTLTELELVGALPAFPAPGRTKEQLESLVDTIAEHLISEKYAALLEADNEKS